MNEFREFFQKQTKKHSEVREAKTVSRNSDGTYVVELVKSGDQITVAKANPFDEFTAGTRIVLNSTTRGENKTGGGGVIVSRAPAESRGLAGTISHEQTETFAGTSVLSQAPDPIELIRGGSFVEGSLYGHGFTVAPTFSDPGIVHDSAAIITPTQATIRPRALVSAVRGYADSIISGYRVRDSIRVVDPVLDRLWIARGSRIYIPDADSLSTSTYVDSGGGATPLYAGPVVAGAYVYAIDSAQRIMRVTRADLSVTLSAAIGFEPVSGSQLVWDGTRLWFGTSSAGLGIVSVLPDGTGATQYVLDGVTYRGLIWDGVHFWLACTGGLRRWSIASGLTNVSVLYSMSRVIDFEGNIYGTRYGGANVLKYQKSTLALQSNISIAGGVFNRGLAAVGDGLYVQQTTGGAPNVSTLYKVLVSNFPAGVVASLANVGERSIVAFGPYLFATSDNTSYGATPLTQVWRIDLATFTVVDSAALSPAAIPAGTSIAYG